MYFMVNSTTRNEKGNHVKGEQVEWSERAKRFVAIMRIHFTTSFVIPITHDINCGDIIELPNALFYPR